MKPETLFRRSVLTFLKKYELKGLITIVTIQNVAVRGVSDIILCVLGKFWAVELKAEGGSATALQNRFLQNVARSSGVSWIVHPNNFEYFKQAIKEAVNDNSND